MSLNRNYDKRKLPKMIPLAEVFKGKPHLERLLKDKPYLRKGNTDC